MSLLQRFFGKSASDESAAEPLVANPTIENQHGLQALFPEARPLDSLGLTRALRAFHRSMRHACCEIDDEFSREGKLAGLAGWERHVVRFLGSNSTWRSRSLLRSWGGTERS